MLHSMWYDIRLSNLGSSILVIIGGFCCLGWANMHMFHVYTFGVKTKLWWRQHLRVCQRIVVKCSHLKNILDMLAAGKYLVRSQPWGFGGRRFMCCPWVSIINDNKLKWILISKGAHSRHPQGLLEAMLFT